MLPKRPRVVIAEDHPGVAKAVCRMLSLDCEVVGNVADGRAVQEVCRQLTQVKLESKVIVFSAMDDPDLQRVDHDMSRADFSGAQITPDHTDAGKAALRRARGRARASNGG